MKGFTLLELLVVLAIAVLAITLVPPLLSGVGGSTELQSAARQLAAGLRATRNKAIGGQGQAVLLVDLEQRFFRAADSDKRYALPEHAGLELFTARSETQDDTVGRIRFFPDGSSSGGRISLSGERVEYLVDVDWLTGRVRVFDRARQ